MPAPKFIYLQTYGCTANKNNSEIMAASIISSGLQIVSKPELADMIIINSCTVKDPTETAIRRRLQNLEKLGKPIILAGCMADVYAKENFGKQVYLLSVSQAKNIPSLIKAISEGRVDKEKQRKYLERKQEIILGNKISENRFIGITQISQGCLGECTYCQTKLAKGSLVSFPEEEIIKQIEKDIKQGSKEIWLTSQDCASYGLENKERKLPQLLEKILSIKGNFKLRLGMMNPENVLPILDDLLVLYENEKLFKFLHIPLQSGSDKILKDMKRKYKAEDFIKIVEKFRNKFPELVLATDIIVGYPTESEKDFYETIRIIKESKPEIFNLSKYWKRKFTYSYTLKEIKREIVKKRATEIMLLHRKIALERNKQLEGKELSVLVDKQIGKNLYQARDNSHRIIVLKSDENILGKTLNVKIEKAFVHHLLETIPNN